MSTQLTVIKRKLPTAASRTAASPKKSKTTAEEIYELQAQAESNKIFMNELKAKAEAAQSMITCTLCRGVAKYPVYASCKLHMFCFHCMFVHITKSKEYDFDFKELYPDLRKMHSYCPLCRHESIDRPYNMYTAFVPNSVYQPVLEISQLILSKDWKDSIPKVKKETDDSNHISTTADELQIIENPCLCPFCKKSLNSLTAADAKDIELKIYNYDTDAFSNPKHQHLVACALENLPCPNRIHGCKERFLEWCPETNTFTGHSRSCDFYRCNSCEGDHYDYDQIKEHIHVSSIKSNIDNTLNHSFTPKEYKLHKCIENLFGHRRFHHTGGSWVIDMFENLLVAVEDQAEDDWKEKTDSDELDYLQMMRGVLDDRIRDLVGPTVFRSTGSIPPRNGPRGGNRRVENSNVLAEEADSDAEVVV